MDTKTHSKEAPEIYEYSSPRGFVRAWLERQPRKGRGILRGWAARFRVHPTLLSQVLTGRRLFTLELAEQIAQAMGLSDAECDFLFLLVQAEQASLPALRARMEKKLEEARAKARQLSSRVRPEKELNEAAKSRFYSSWIYSAIRNLSAIPRFQSVGAIAEQLGLPRELVQGAADFLVENGLCTLKGGRLGVGEQRTYVNADSPLVIPHHQNWRGRAVAQMAKRRKPDFFLTVPMSLSEKDAERVRNRLLKCFEEINEIITPSPSETARCLNIDYFEV